MNYFKVICTFFAWRYPHYNYGCGSCSASQANSCQDNCGSMALDLFRHHRCGSAGCRWSCVRKVSKPKHGWLL